jgi:hypothetical protein
VCRRITSVLRLAQLNASSLSLLSYVQDSLDPCLISRLQVVKIKWHFIKIHLAPLSSLKALIRWNVMSTDLPRAYSP